MQRPAKKRIARFESRIGERIGGWENGGVVIGIVPGRREPADGMGLHGKIHAAGAGKVSVEIIARAKWTAGSNGARSKTDYIVKAIGEVISGETQPVGAQELLETNVVSAATFGAERGIARIAGIGGARLLESGVLDALAAGGSQPSVPPKAFAVTQSERGASAGKHAHAKTAVGFGALASVQREAAQA